MALNILEQQVVNDPNLKGSYNLDDIELSPMLEVNQMLWADKLQNQKDFRAYHLGKHDRSDILEQYFINWINKLEPIINKLNQ